MMSTQCGVDEEQMERTVELINNFIISTTQFMNRFAEECNAKLYRSNRSLQRLEASTFLLEAQLSDIKDALGAAVVVANDKGEIKATASPPLKNDSARRGRPGALQRPPPMPALGALVAGGASHSLSSPPPPPPVPPLPPGYKSTTPATKEEPADRRQEDAAIAKPPPLLPGLVSPPAAPTTTVTEVGTSVSIPPPPSRPPQTEKTMKQFHPRLHGFFELLTLGVPESDVKARMEDEGLDPGWLEEPSCASFPAALASTVIAFVDDVSYMQRTRVK